VFSPDRTWEPWITADEIGSDVSGAGPFYEVGPDAFKAVSGDRLSMVGRMARAARVPATVAGGGWVLKE